MAVACPVDPDTQRLRSEVSGLYSRVAVQPGGTCHFHRGPAYAAAFLGYDEAELATLPADTSAAFAGVANPHSIGPIGTGETVLDIGCGAGMDLLVAARKVGPAGKAIGVDMTEAMIERGPPHGLSASPMWRSVKGMRLHYRLRIQAWTW